MFALANSQLKYLGDKNLIISLFENLDKKVSNKQKNKNAF
jgi:hypothetical protein